MQKKEAKNSSSSAEGKLLGLAEAEVCICYLVLLWREAFVHTSYHESICQVQQGGITRDKANPTEASLLSGQSIPLKLRFRATTHTQMWESCCVYTLGV